MSRRYSIRYAAISHMGKVRTNNEDNLFLDGKYLEAEELNTPFIKTGEVSADAAVFAVCDGMGGEDFGEVASMTCVQSISEQYKLLTSKKVDLRSTIEEFVSKANEAVCKISSDKGKRIGTTLAMILFHQNSISVANLGDSRIYLFRKNALKQLSEDHTQAQTLIRTGALSEEAAKTHPSRNMLTQHLGIFPNELIIEPHILIDQMIFEKDCWLICSDGLTDLLSDEEIGSVLAKKENIEQVGKELVEIALTRGAHDNITCIILQAEKKRFFTFHN